MTLGLCQKKGKSGKDIVRQCHLLFLLKILGIYPCRDASQLRIINAKSSKSIYRLSPQFANEGETEYFHVIDVNAGSGMCKDPYA